MLTLCNFCEECEPTKCTAKISGTDIAPVHCSGCQSLASYDYVKCDGSYGTESLCKFHGDYDIKNPTQDVCVHFHGRTCANCAYFVCGESPDDSSDTNYCNRHGVCDYTACPEKFVCSGHCYVTCSAPEQILSYYPSDDDDLPF